MTKKTLSLVIVSLIFTCLPVTTFWHPYDPIELPKVILYILNTLILAVIVSYSMRYVKWIFFLFYIPTMFLVTGFFSIASVQDGISLLFGQFYRYQGVLYYASLSLFALCIFSTIRSKLISTQRITQLLLISGILTAIIIIVQFVLNSTTGNFPPMMPGRYGATLGNPNFAAAYLMIVSGFLIRKHSLKILLLYSVAIILTGSRLAIIWIALVLIFRLVYSLKFRIAPNTYRVLIIGIFTLLLIGTYIIMSRPISHYDSRTDIYMRGLMAISNRPLIGWGVDHFYDAYQSTLTPQSPPALAMIRVDKAHNELLEYGISAGILGIVGYIFFWGTITYLLYKIRWSLYRWELVCAFLAYFAYAQVNVVNITTHMILYVCIGMLLAINEENQLTPANSFVSGL